MKDLECTRALFLLKRYLEHLKTLGVYNRQFSGDYPWVMVGYKKVHDKFLASNHCPVSGCGAIMSYFKIESRRKVGEEKYADAPRQLPLFVRSADNYFELNGNKLALDGSPEFGVCPNIRHETVRLHVYNRNPVRKNDSGYLIHQYTKETDEWKLLKCPT